MNMNIEVIHIRDIHEYSYIHDHVASVVGDGAFARRRIISTYSKVFYLRTKHT